MSMNDSVKTLREASNGLLRLLEEIEAHPAYSQMRTNLPEQAEDIREKVPDIKADVITILEEIDRGKSVSPEETSRRVEDMRRSIWASQYLLQRLNGEPLQKREPN